MAESISSIALIASPTGSGVAAPAMRQSSERAINAAARLFNLRDEDVQKLMARGSSLQDIAADRGVNRGQLVSAVRETFQSNGSRMDYQTSNELAQAFVSRKGQTPNRHR